MAYKSVATENVQKGRFASHAQRNPEFQISVRGNPSDTLRRDVPDSSFLQKDRSEETNPKEFGSALFSQSNRISFFGTDPGFALCDHNGHEEDQQDRGVAIQRILFGNSWFESFSRSKYVAQIFETIESSIHSSTGQASRQSAGIPFWIAEQTDQFGVRFGFGGDHCVWQTRRISSGIQSQETRKTIVSSLVLLRSKSSRILARFSAAGQHDRGYGSRSVYENLSGQGTQRYCQKSDSVPNGFRILRAKKCQIPRRFWLRLRDCRQRICPDQDRSATMQIPTSRQWLGGRGILCQDPSEVGSSPSFYCGSPSYSPRSRGSQTIDFVQRYQVCLSCLYHQSRNVTLASVSILQSKGNNRKKQSGIFIRLSFRQNPNKNMDSQRCLFSIAFIRGQYCPLVQKNLSAQRISYDHTRYDTNRLFSSTSKINQAWQSKYFVVAKRLFTSQRVPTGFDQYSKIASA